MTKPAHFVSLPPYEAYYMHVDKRTVVNKLRYRYDNKSIIYGIRCRLTNQLYVGSTSVPMLRFFNHLISGHPSNPSLQAAIAKYGLHKFVVYIFEVVKYPEGVTTQAEQMQYLRSVEQKYINQFPKDQLYNSINSIK